MNKMSQNFEFVACGLRCDVTGGKRVEAAAAKTARAFRNQAEIALTLPL
jgi:tRNA threonylcarbamoyladenosine modification (KEOPS) complex Cgi121 subunit